MIYSQVYSFSRVADINVNRGYIAKANLIKNIFPS